jgi:sulfur carrier protein
MRCVINGQSRDLPEGVTVAGFLASEGLAKQPCAVEINRQIVPKREHEDTPLRDGDSVEIVTLVGGG